MVRQVLHIRVEILTLCPLVILSPFLLENDDFCCLGVLGYCGLDTNNIRTEEWIQTQCYICIQLDVANSTLYEL